MTEPRQSSPLDAAVEKTAIRLGKRCAFPTHYKRAPLSSKLRLLCKSSQPKLEERNTQMDSVKYIGLDVHRDTISGAVVDQSGRLVMHSVIPTQASAILDCVSGIHPPLGK